LAYSIKNVILPNLKILDYRYYDKDGEGHDHFYEDKDLLDFYDKKIKKLKSHYKVKISEMIDNFKYHYTIGSSNVKNDLNIDNDKSYEIMAKNYDNIFDNDIKQTIEYIIYDMETFLINQIKKIQDDKWKQWRTF
jgi:hypothetical protein